MVNLDRLIDMRLVATKAADPSVKHEGVVVGYGDYLGKNLLYLLQDDGLLAGKFLSDYSFRAVKQGSDVKG